MIQERKKRSSSKANLIISAVFHGVIILVIFYFAAKEGILGKKLKQMTATIVPKEKKLEPPKEKPPEPKVEQAKVEQPKMALPQPKIETAAAPPSDAPPAVAPAAVNLPDFELQGGKEVQSIATDPTSLYKALVEYTLRSRWNRPEDPAFDKNVAEVELTVDKSGQILDSTWIKGSGDAKWDDSVKAALAQTSAISKPPPKGFPEKFKVRFDVQTTEAVEAIQVSIR